MSQRPAGGERYELEDQIGSGGMATVYLARDSVLQRPVALKVLNENVDPTLKVRFVEEARAVAQLNHPNIVNVYDVGEMEDEPYIVMEYVRGSNLKHLIEQRGALPTAEAENITSQVGAALSYAHRNGFVHCDVKPHNILVTPDGRAKLVDFGIAQAQVDRRKRDGEQVYGSPLYIAPEQAAGEQVTPRTDVYGLGLVLWEALAGRPPERAAPSEPVILPFEEAGLPRRLADVIRRATASEPEARYASIDEMLAAMRATRGDSRPAPLSGQRTVAFKPVSDGGDARAASMATQTIRQNPGPTSESRPSSAPASETRPVGAARQRREPPVAEMTAPARPTATPAAPIEAPAPLSRPGRRRLPLLPVAAFVLLLCGLGAIALGSGLQNALGSGGNPLGAIFGGRTAPPGTVPVPDLTGKPTNEATEALTASGLTPDVAEVPRGDTPGTVVAQEPDPGTMVPPGATITVEVTEPTSPTEPSGTEDAVAASPTEPEEDGVVSAPTMTRRAPTARQPRPRATPTPRLVRGVRVAQLLALREVEVEVSNWEPEQGGEERRESFVLRRGQYREIRGRTMRISSERAVDLFVTVDGGRYRGTLMQIVQSLEPDDQPPDARLTLRRRSSAPPPSTSDDSESEQEAGGSEDEDSPADQPTNTPTPAGDADEDEEGDTPTPTPTPDPTPTPSPEPDEQSQPGGGSGDDDGDED